MFAVSIAWSFLLPQLVLSQDWQYHSTSVLSVDILNSLDGGGLQLDGAQGQVLYNEHRLRCSGRPLDRDLIGPLSFLMNVEAGGGVLHVNSLVSICASEHLGGNAVVNMGGFCPAYTNFDYPWFEISPRAYQTARLFARLRSYCVAKCYCAIPATARRCSVLPFPQFPKRIIEEPNLVPHFVEAQAASDLRFAPIYFGPTVYLQGSTIPAALTSISSHTRYEHKYPEQAFIQCTDDIPFWPVGARLALLYADRTGPYWPWRNLRDLCAAALVGGSPSGNVGLMCHRGNLIVSYGSAHPLLTQTDEWYSRPIVYYCFANCWCRSSRAPGPTQNILHMIVGKPELRYRVQRRSWIEGGRPTLDHMELIYSLDNGGTRSSTVVASNTILPPPAVTLPSTATSTSLRSPTSTESGGAASMRKRPRPDSNNPDISDLETESDDMPDSEPHRQRQSTANSCNAKAQQCSAAGECGGRGCACRVDRTAGSSRADFVMFGIGACHALLSIASKDKNPGELGKREWEVEGWACACNTTYVSTACCDSLGGMVWETAQRKMGSLKDR